MTLVCSLHIIALTACLTLTSVLSNTTTIDQFLSSPNTPLCEESDTMDVEANEESSISSKAGGPGDESQLNLPLEGSSSTLRVRFRPRVRITSGLNRHRHTQPTTENHQDYFTFTSPSSNSSSASSSISAPLRTPLDDEVGKPGWGTLGQRVALFAKRQYPDKTTRHNPEGDLIAKGNVAIDTEQTPLLNPSLHFLLRHDSGLHYLYHNSSDEEISRWTDRAFGPWPARLLNHHVRARRRLNLHTKLITIL